MGKTQKRGGRGSGKEPSRPVRHRNIRQKQESDLPDNCIDADNAAKRIRGSAG